MNIEDLSTEAMAQITSYLCGTASIFLFLTGSVRLRRLLTLRGGITHMELIDRSSLSTSRWPMFLSSLTGLRELKINRGFGPLGDFNVIWSELTKLSSLRVLQFRSLCTDLTPDIISNIENFNSFGLFFPQLEQLSLLTFFTTAVISSLPQSIWKLELSPAKGYTPIRQSLTYLASLPPTGSLPTGDLSSNAIDQTPTSLFPDDSENLPFLRSLDVFDVVKIGKGHPLLAQLQKLPLTTLSVSLSADVGNQLPPTLTKLKLHSHKSCNISNLPYTLLEHLTLSGGPTNVRKLRPFRKLRFLNFVGRLAVSEDPSGVYYFPEDLTHLIMEDQRIKRFSRVILPENLSFLEAPFCKWRCIETEVSKPRSYELKPVSTNDAAADILETRSGFPAALISLLDSEQRPNNEANRGAGNHALPPTLTALDYRYLDATELDQLASSLISLNMNNCSEWPTLTSRLCNLTKLVLQEVKGVPNDFLKECPKNLKQLCLHAVWANIPEESFKHFPTSLEKLDLRIEHVKQPGSELTTKGLHFLSLLPQLKRLCLPHDMMTIEDSNLALLPPSLRTLRLRGDCPLLTTGCFWYLPRFLKVLEIRWLDIGIDEDTVHLPRTLRELSLPQMAVLTPACGPLLPATISVDLVNSNLPLNCQSLIKTSRGNLNQDSKIQSARSLNFGLTLPKSPRTAIRPSATSIREEIRRKKIRHVFFLVSILLGLPIVVHGIEIYNTKSLWFSLTCLFVLVVIIFGYSVVLLSAKFRLNQEEDVDTLKRALRPTEGN